MSKDIKDIITEQLKILNSISEEVAKGFTEYTLEQQVQLSEAVYHEVNDWMLSDKISSERQQYRDSFKPSSGGQGGAVSFDSSAPTPAQINYATTLGINVEGKTKKEVSDLIDKAVKKQKKVLG